MCQLTHDITAGKLQAYNLQVEQHNNPINILIKIEQDDDGGGRGGAGQNNSVDQSQWRIIADRRLEDDVNDSRSSFM